MVKMSFFNKSNDDAYLNILKKASMSFLDANDHF